MNYWLNFNGKLKIPVKPAEKIIVKKCPEIGKLECYSVNPKDDFWEKFPFNPLPEKPVTSVNVEALGKRLKKVEDSLTWAQKYRGERCIKNLTEGASACQKTDLPPCFCQNSKSTIAHGELVTDTIASWVKQGFVSGPFIEPPLNRFIVNPLMAVEQDDKVRLVMNVSLPKDQSLNDNIDGSNRESTHVFC